MSIGECRMLRAVLGGAGRRFAAFLMIVVFLVFGYAGDTGVYAEIISGTVDDREWFMFDFEDGLTEGWRPSSEESAQAVTGVEIGHMGYAEGAKSLKINVDLDIERDNFHEGFAHTMLPGNMLGKTVWAAVFFTSADAGGTPGARNGIRLFVRDQNHRFQFSKWKNIVSDVPVGQWYPLSFRPDYGDPNLDDPHTDEGFDPTRIMSVGVQIAANQLSEDPFQGYFYLDYFYVERKPFAVPESDHPFLFDDLTPEHQAQKTFGYGPYMGSDPFWGAGAWDSGDISASQGAIEVAADFFFGQQTVEIDGKQVVVDGQKGYVGIESRPLLDLANKENKVVRAEIRTDPYVGPGEMLANIWVYDIRDGRSEGGSEDRIYSGRDIIIGGSVWNEIVFDLKDAEHFTQKECPNCIPQSEIDEDNSLRSVLKVGIQVWSNIEYSGTIYIDNLTVGGREKENFANGNHGFVGIAGPNFALNGAPYRFGGVNSYYLFYKSHYMIDDVLQTAIDNGIDVVRTWAFCDGNNPYGGGNGFEGVSFQPEMGLYYEPTFQNLDYVIKAAGELGVRLILPLVNHWSDKDYLHLDKDKAASGSRGPSRDSCQDPPVPGDPYGGNSFGGMSQYVEWCGVPLEYGCWEDDGDRYTKTIRNRQVFYSNPCAKQAFKNYVSFVLNRVNHLTGIAYKDDPTILAWELANEPRCEEPDLCGAGQFGAWVAEMSAHLKSIDANHLLAVGDEGFFDTAECSLMCYNHNCGVDWEQNLAIASIDFGTVHLYPDHWERDIAFSREWIEDHIDKANIAGKPVVLEEFGILADAVHEFSREEIYRQWMALARGGGAGNEGLDGDLVWMLGGQVNNADEDHVEIGGKLYYPDYDGFTFHEPHELTTLASQHALRMRNGYFNAAPTAADKSATAICYEKTPLVLEGADGDGDILFFRIARGPDHGVLTGDPPALEYEPNPGYVGPDSFSYVANDLLQDSAEATFDISVEYGDPRFRMELSSVRVPEGGFASFRLAMAAPPEETVAASIEFRSGDADIQEAPGQDLEFSPSDWMRFREVRLEAKEDADQINGETTLAVVADGVQELVFTAKEAENDLSPCLPGDLDSDGMLGLADASLYVGAIYRRYVPASGLRFIACHDLNGDGKIGLEDLACLLQTIAGAR